jgi:uncharacterized membrane protein
MSLDPYRMVFVNIIASLFLIACIGIYKKLYPKKKTNFLVLLLLISCLPLISILRNGSYESGDLSLHVSITIPMFESLKEGNLFPIWNQYIMNGYGYPLYLFVYPLPYYLLSFIHFFGLTFINSLKLLLGLSFVASGIAMFFFLKEELKNQLAAFTGAIFYLFAPYHLVDLHFRVTVGEVLAFAFLPMCFLFLKKFYSSGSLVWTILLSISLSLLILSHQAISLISLPFLLIYIIFLFAHDKDKKLLFGAIAALTTGVLLSSFYWLPLLIEAKYTSLLGMSLYFAPVFSLIFSPYKYGLLFQGNMGQLYFPIGYAHLAVIVISIFAIFLVPIFKRKYSKNERNIYLISLIGFLITFFMMLPISKPIWQIMPLLKGFEFTYRFSLFCAFFSSIIAAVVLPKFRKSIIYAVLAFAILVTILNWGNRRVLPGVTDSTLKAGLSKSLSAAGSGAATLIWTNTKFLSGKRNGDINILSGDAKIVETFRNSTRHEYSIKVSSEKALFKENTLYFPDWVVKVNGKSYPFSYKNSSFPGIITFDLAKGKYNVEVVFLNTQISIFSLYLSFITFTGISIFSIYLLYRFLTKSRIHK